MIFVAIFSLVAALSRWVYLHTSVANFLTFHRTMMSTDCPDYELLDFGCGRKLERFGAWVLDRPCPTVADVAKAQPEIWQDATARFDGGRAGDGVWLRNGKPWVTGSIAVVVGASLPSPLTFHLAPLPSGQVGLFPEQLSSWQWIAGQIKRSKQPLRVLNLFAYTGGSTLAAASVGAKVTHVDAAKSAVARARKNAMAVSFPQADDLSSKKTSPIRWIVEDAAKFCAREVKRGNQYDAVILDPPSYGHGPKGETWRIEQDLLPLLKLCGRLTAGRLAFVLVTCHTPSIGPAELSAYLSDGIFGSCSQPPSSGTLALKTGAGRILPSGVFARWPG